METASLFIFPYFSFSDLSLQGNNALNSEGGCTEGNNSSQYNYCQQWKNAAFYVSEISNDTNTRRNKEKGHVLKQKIRLLTDVINLEHLEEKKQKKQNHTDDTARNCNGQKDRNDLSDKTDAENHPDLKH
jgi:hypothetical protein